MATNAPTVMVSSTYYDLRQVRDNLKRFIEGQLKYNSLLSEHSSFPIDPDASTIENCRRRIKHDADVLVLIIGGRYGYVDKASSKSVTNLEYLAARAKGIPIYAFIDKKVLALLPIWEANKDADFSSVTDDPKVFDFIEQVRSIDGVWTNEFENAQDIIDGLLSQFAYLQQEGLRWKLNFRRADSSAIANNLQGKALQIALEKGDLWQHFLFVQVLVDEIGKSSTLREDHLLDMVTRFGDVVKPEDFGFWHEIQIKRAAVLIENLAILFNQHLPDAMGRVQRPTSENDALVLVHVAKKIGVIYQQLLEWSLTCRGTLTHDCFAELIKFLSTMVDDPIKKIEDLGPSLMVQLNDALPKIRTGQDVRIGGPITLEFFDGGKHSYLLGAALDCINRSQSTS